MSSVSADIKKPEDTVPSAQYDVVVVGAGPYGLSAAAHLKAQGLKVTTFGKPIYFWREHMPEGMLLRSYWWATDLSDPLGTYSFQRYFEEKGLQGVDPLPIETFIDYGMWFQKNAVPDVDETYVANIARYNEQFLVTLVDGRVIQCKSVVMAPGLHYYRYCPTEYAHMPETLVSHSADHRVLSKFAGKSVAVIGRGQAAIETSALLREGGASVRLIARHTIYWIPDSKSRSKIPGFIRSLRAPTAGMGNGWLNLLLEKYPYIFQRLPRDTRDYVLVSRHGPAGSPWLKDRVIGKITLYEQKQIEHMAEVDGRVELTLSSREKVVVDHVILATGYQADVKMLPMLDMSLIDGIKTYKKAPQLNNWFESSVPGLYFIGFSAARSFGPYYRFVIGDGAAARRVTQAIARRVARMR